MLKCVHCDPDWFDDVYSLFPEVPEHCIHIMISMKPQVGCTTLGLVRDNKNIKTIMVPRPSYQTRLNQEHKQAQSKRHILQ